MRPGKLSRHTLSQLALRVHPLSEARRLARHGVGDLQLNHASAKSIAQGIAQIVAADVQQ